MWCFFVDCVWGFEVWWWWFRVLFAWIGLCLVGWLLILGSVCMASVWVWLGLWFEGL